MTNIINDLLTENKSFGYKEIEYLMKRGHLKPNFKVLENIEERFVARAGIGFLEKSKNAVEFIKGSLLTREIKPLISYYQEILGASKTNNPEEIFQYNVIFLIHFHLAHKRLREEKKQEIVYC